MIEDFQTSVENGAELRFDVCVAGAGAAGITLALALAETGLKVGVFEGGGLHPPSGDARDLYAGNVGPKPYPLQASRLRYFGGTTNHWGGWCRPLDPIDFERRDAIPLSGWAVSRNELDPYYDQAHRICEIDSTIYQTDEALSESPDSLLDLPRTSGFVNKLFRFSPPTRFGSVYRDRLRESRNVTVLLHANVVGIDSRKGEITQFHLRSLDGKQASVAGRTFVLAMGGIENARLLLHSDDGSGMALGNQSDFVGRCFMDHFGFRPGYVLTYGQLRYFRHSNATGELLPIISMSDEALRSAGLRNFCITLQPDEPSVAFPPHALQNPGFAPGIPQDQQPIRYHLQYINEPTPNRDSRVYLTRDVDALGMHRVHLDWRFNEADLENVGHITERLAATLGQSGSGRLQHTRYINEETVENISGGMHHMGTTRMSNDPVQGVVDMNCRVHGTTNLHVAGSSVFPTVGFSNPTLTIVALALRLAERIKTVIKESS